MVKILNLEQGSKEWLDLKRNSIGSSYAAAIMGCSPYATAYEIWRFMIGIDEYPREKSAGHPDKNLGFKLGKEKEETARFLLNSDHPLGEFKPLVGQSSNYDWMISSLDGICQCCNKAHEIKCLTVEKHRDTCNQWVVPKEYYPQLQHHMYVWDLDNIAYTSYCDKANDLPVIYSLNVERDDKFLADYIPKAKKFWECVCTLTEPDKVQRDYEDLSHKARYRKLEAAYIEADAKSMYYDKRKERLKKMLIREGKGQNVIGSQTKLTTYYAPGKIDYKKIESLKTMNLECYRGQPTKATRITKL